MKRLPTIRKAKGNERVFGNYVVMSGKSGDITRTFGAALRYWLWHLGVSPRIAFYEFRRKKK